MSALYGTEMARRAGQAGENDPRPLVDDRLFGWEGPPTPTRNKTVSRASGDWCPCFTLRIPYYRVSSACQSIRALRGVMKFCGK